MNKSFVSLLVLSSLHSSVQAMAPSQSDWAVNFGGEEYSSETGIVFEKDSLMSASSASTITEKQGVGVRFGSIDVISGSQEPAIFQTFREGDFGIKRALENGEYNITMYFAEPQDVAIGKRLFDVVAEGSVIASDVDIRKLRDGNIHAGLTHTISGVEVRDGVLDIEFIGKNGQPVVSAISVHRKEPMRESWELVWSDEFDGDGQLDTSKWNIEEWPIGKVNNEDQSYHAGSKNLRVENGNLVIEAHKEAKGYSSGRVQSMEKADFLYGRVDVRAKLPAGQGTWSAIWMLPSDPYRYATSCKPNEDMHGSSTCDAWPNSGEIDIMEHVGYDMNRVHGTVHTKAYYWVNGQQRKASIDGKDVAEDFHVYSLEWSPNRIDILMDDAVYFTYMNQGEGWEAWPFDHPYHVILNLAIGGDWGRAGGPIDDSIFPTQMLVDYVRVYQQREETSESIGD